MLRGFLDGFGFPEEEQHRLLGFAFARGRFFNAPYWAVAVPYWFLVSLTLILPIRAWILCRRRRGRATSGRCLACGYDLRGSAERCPDCGAPTATRSPSASQPAML